jgi:hypothetical protein
MIPPHHTDALHGAPEGEDSDPPFELTKSSRVKTDMRTIFAIVGAAVIITAAWVRMEFRQSATEGSVSDLKIDVSGVKEDVKALQKDQNDHFYQLLNRLDSIQRDSRTRDAKP